MSLASAQVRATIAVSDMTKAVEFYEGTLGLSPHGDEIMGHVRIYPCGGRSLLQVYASEHAGTATATVASWSADDFESVVEDLKAKGVTFRNPGRPGDRRDWRPHVRRAQGRLVQGPRRQHDRCRQRRRAVVARSTAGFRLRSSQVRTSGDVRTPASRCTSRRRPAARR
jgi:catechol 2,3-dioxygenase-like lactoylglutathione lyase family enzyme